MGCAATSSAPQGPILRDLPSARSYPRGDRRGPHQGAGIWRHRRDGQSAGVMPRVSQGEDSEGARPRHENAGWRRWMAAVVGSSLEQGEVMSIVERGVTVHDLNMAVLKFLGIADEANDITRVEVHVGVDEFPKGVITKLMRHTDKLNYPMSR